MAVLAEGEKNIKSPLSLLPDGCREGDVLNISIERDPEATRQANKRLMEKLKKKTKKGKEHEFSEKRSCKPGQPSSHITPIFASTSWLAF